MSTLRGTFIFSLVVSASLFGESFRLICSNAVVIFVCFMRAGLWLCSLGTQSTRSFECLGAGTGMRLSVGAGDKPSLGNVMRLPDKMSGL